MIKLAEIVHTIQAANHEGLSEIDNWKITDADFMTDMGFKASGLHHFSLDNPKMKVCHKKNEGFILEDESKNVKQTFPKFNDLIEYFTKYQQQWENSPYNE